MIVEREERRSHPMVTLAVVWLVVIVGIVVLLMRPQSVTLHPDGPYRPLQQTGGAIRQHYWGPTDREAANGTYLCLGDKVTCTQ